jgi:hypothetical protein
MLCPAMSSWNQYRGANIEIYDFIVSSKYLKDSGRISDEQIKESHCKKKSELQIHAPEQHLYVSLVSSSHVFFD